jgi:ABC-type transporter Mla MlaB component
MTARFELPPELNIYSALETRDALLAWVSEQAAHSPEFLEVSARNVEEVDGAGLQLLAALSHMDTPWRLVQASDAFCAACRGLGLTDWLDPRYLQGT